MKRMGMSSWNVWCCSVVQVGRSLLSGLTIAIVGFIVMLGAIAPAYAANPDHVTQLLETNACPGCDLEKADLRGANLRDSNLEGANLKGAYLMATNLRHANLKGANLDLALMYAANLTDADLTDTSVRSVGLGSALICHTRTPDGTVSNRDCDQYAN